MRAHQKKVKADLLWEEIVGAQLTSEEKDRTYAEAERHCEQAFREGVYARALEIVGTVKWSVSWKELRGKRRLRSSS